MTLWDRNRERRQKRIIAAAAEIIAEDGLSGLSMRKLGRAAEVSVATIYSICGNRDEILWAVIRDRFAMLGSAVAEVPEGKPIKRMSAIITATADHLGQQAHINRAVLLAATELGPSPGSPASFVGDAFTTAIRDAIEAKLLSADLNPEVLSGHILRAYLQAMIAWARGFVTDRGFEALATYSMCESLLGIATEPTRSKLLAVLQRLEPQILKGQSVLLSPENQAKTA